MAEQEVPTLEVVPKHTTLAAKLIRAMSQVGVVEKRGNNQKQGYKFVKATDVANEVRQALIECGVSFSYDIEEERSWEKATNAGGVLFFCGLKIRGDFRDSESGEVISGRAIGWGADSLDKAPYKAMTGALKYLLRMNFLIPDEEDPETDNDHYDPKDDLKPVPSVAARQVSSAPSQQQSRPSIGGPKTITDAQQKRFFAIAKGNNLSKDDMIRVVRKFGFNGIPEITMAKYEDVCEALKYRTEPEPKNSLTTTSRSKRKAHEGLRNPIRDRSGVCDLRKPAH
jgi:hypothetical protein